MIRNIERIDYSNIEFLISDRHLEDDTLERLQRHFGTPENIKYFAIRDGLNWVENCNFLLRMAAGKYFRWLPHDDIIPRCSIRAMVQYLETHEDTVLVYGLTEGIDREGNRLAGRTRLNTHPVAENDDWSFDLPLLMNFEGTFDGAFKGLFRLDVVRKHNLEIIPTFELIGSERCFLFALALLGRFYYHPHYHYQKVFHPDSVSAKWNADERHVRSKMRVMLRYLMKLAPGIKRKFWGAVALHVLSSKKRALLRGRTGTFRGFNCYGLFFGAAGERALISKLRTL